MKIALTFDIERDLPNVLDTYNGIKNGLPKILDILDTYDIQGTFFFTGSIANKFPNYVRLVEKKSHEVACHSLNHRRLRQMNLKECEEMISENKKILEEICVRSTIIGFRAPYLKSHEFLIKILHNLGFKYDSSIKSNHKVDMNELNSYSIREFQPLDISLRMPFGYSILKRWILKNQVTILYFHPLDIIDTKNLMVKQKSKLNLFRDYLLRPDRWIKTGEMFIKRFNKFIQYALTKNAEFVTLRDMINE
ncbi:MAG: polysaccharide deacetylase family protein [Promethearchaeota archaeon]